jgi:hypothetical protein
MELCYGSYSIAAALLSLVSNEPPGVSSEFRTSIVESVEDLLGAL